MVLHHCMVSGTNSFVDHPVPFLLTPLPCFKPLCCHLVYSHLQNFKVLTFNTINWKLLWCYFNVTWKKCGLSTGKLHESEKQYQYVAGVTEICILYLCPLLPLPLSLCTHEAQGPSMKTHNSLDEVWGVNDSSAIRKCVQAAACSKLSVCPWQTSTTAQGQEVARFEAKYIQFHLQTLFSFSLYTFTLQILSPVLLYSWHDNQ